MGGVPHLRSGWGGTPSQVLVGEYPIRGPGWGGVPHPRSRWGDTHPRSGRYPISGGGYPIPVGRVPGEPPTRSGWWGYPGTPQTRSGWWGGHTWGTPSTRSGWGTPQPGLDGGGILGVPSPPGPGLDGDGGTPDQVWIRQSSIASTCYAVGGVPLAFTQEDFLVLKKIFTFHTWSLTIINT